MWFSHSFLDSSYCILSLFTSVVCEVFMVCDRHSLNIFNAHVSDVGGDDVTMDRPMGGFPGQLIANALTCD